MYPATFSDVVRYWMWKRNLSKKQKPEPKASDKKKASTESSLSPSQQKTLMNKWLKMLEENTGTNLYRNFSSSSPNTPKTPKKASSKHAPDRTDEWLKLLEASTGTSIYPKYPK